MFVSMGSVAYIPATIIKYTQLAKSMQYWKLALLFRRNSLASITFCTIFSKSGATWSFFIESIVGNKIPKQFYYGSLSVWLFPGAMGVFLLVLFASSLNLMKIQIQLWRRDEEKRDSNSGWLLLLCWREKDCDISLIAAVEEMKPWLRARFELNINMRVMNIILIIACEKQMPPPPLSVAVTKGSVPAHEKWVGITHAAYSYDKRKGFLSWYQNFRTTQILAQALSFVLGFSEETKFSINQQLLSAIVKNMVSYYSLNS